MHGHWAKPRAQLVSTLSKGLVSSADMHARYAVTPSVRFRLELLAFFPLEVLQVPVVRTGTLRKWNPRPACGTAFSSAHPILSVFGLVPTRDEPAECVPWTRRTGVCPTYPLPGYRAARVGGLGRTYDDFVSF